MQVASMASPRSTAISATCVNEIGYRKDHLEPCSWLSRGLASRTIASSNCTVRWLRALFRSSRRWFRAISLPRKTQTFAACDESRFYRSMVVGGPMGQRQ
jgi:hypothetical protein